MKGEYFVSDILTPDRLQSGFINILQCPTGSGKTTAILEKLVYSVDTLNEILFITDCNINLAQISSKYPHTCYYSKDWREYINSRPKGKLAPIGFGSASKAYVTIMNYHQVGTILHYGHPFDWSKFSYVILDEAHNLINYQNIKSKDGSVNILKYTEAKINDTLMYYTDVKILALTATPNNVYKHFKNARSVFTAEEVENLYQYEVGRLWYYRDIYKVLPLIPVGKRGIIYTSRIAAVKEYQEFLTNKGHKAIGFWSDVNEKHPLTEEQQRVRNHIIKHEKIPQEYDILLINKAMETGANIKNKDLTFMIIHAPYNSDTYIQAKGRIRNDIENVYFLNKYINDANTDIPAEYLNTPLNKKQKDYLCENVVRYLKKDNKPYKWKEVKKLLETKGYRIRDKHNRNGKSTERVSIIEKITE